MAAILPAILVWLNAKAEDMSETLRYDLMVENAFRDIVRQALGQAATDGLHGAHHFFITFDTKATGVEISDALRDRFPDEMTIVLQHQYWDLVVEEEKFSVLLSFANTPTQLVVPFAALTAFVDPAVKFGLQFRQDQKDGLAGDAHGVERMFGGADIAAAEGEPPANEQDPEDAALNDTGAPGDTQDQRGGSAEVVALDQFRKKK